MQSTKTILFINGANTVGGAEQSMIQTIKYLSNLHYRICVAIPKAPGDPLGESLKPYVDKIIYTKIPVWSATSAPSTIQKIKMKFYRLRHYGIPLMVLARLFMISRKFAVDLVHTNTLHTNIGRRLARWLKVPHVQHLRELSGCSEISQISIHGQEDPVSFRRKHGQNDGLIANSKFCLDFNRSWFEGDKEKIIYNPVQSISIKKQISRENVVRVSMLANVTSSWKNHQLFIKIAAAYLQNHPQGKIIFKIYGKIPTGTSSYYQGLINLVDRFKISEYVHFMNSIPASEAYAGTDILVHTSPFESFGRIFIEAMGCGIPVIGVASGGAKELITHEYNGLLIKGSNLKGFVEGIERVIADNNLREHLISNGRATAVGFSPEKVLQELPNFYKQVMNA